MSQSPPTPDTPENWDAASQGYSEKIAPALMRSFAATMVDRLGIDSSAEALEVGAGSGAITEELAPRVKSVLATDFAPKMIDILQERMAAIGASNVRCAVMDGQALEVDDASFDCAMAAFAVMLFPDRVKGFSELRRSLRPGGRVVVSAWAGPDKFEALGIFLGAIATAFPEMPPPPAPPPVFSLADPAVLKAEMETGGFTEVTVEQEARDLQINDFDEMWGMLTIGAPPVKMLFDRIGTAGVDKLRQTLNQIVQERFGGGPIQLTNVANIASGVVPG